MFKNVEGSGRGLIWVTSLEFALKDRGIPRKCQDTRSPGLKLREPCSSPPLFSLWSSSPYWASAVSLSRLHNRTQTHMHSAGLLWTSDQSDAETSTWKHTTFIEGHTSIHGLGGFRNRSPSKRSAPYPLLRRGHWDRSTAVKKWNLRAHNEWDFKMLKLTTVHL